MKEKKEKEQEKEGQELGDNIQERQETLATPENKEELVEALLFISGKFLSLEEISSFCNLGIGEVRAILENLLKKYSQGAITILGRDDFYKMDVKTQYSSLINKIASGESEFSKAEQQTLAVIAYKKPIRQSIIIKIRGNKAYDHVKKFLELGLLTSKKAGRTYILDLSENFYNYFSISEGKFKELKDINIASGNGD
ncbi:MAG: SMC-Scp complex subunit ScpB [Nanoarchaeota archaeon]|nr:SMC-Scp complex subunit ScpB [Nanoarchaeota archaeon]